MSNNRKEPSGKDDVSTHGADAQGKIRKVDRIHQRKCNCGICKLCLHRKTAKKYYRRHRERIKREVYFRRHYELGPDIDMDKLNAYWERVKC